MMDDVKKARLQRKLEEIRKRNADKQPAGFTKILPEKPKSPPPWLSSSSRVPCTVPLFRPPRAPVVYYTDKAWYKISYLVREARKEVGWLGTVSRRGKFDFLIEDVWVPKQKVTAGTTEIDPEGFHEIQQILLAENIDLPLAYWGHSHVNMDVGPSSTDERQTQGYVESTCNGDFFIRGIYNKSGNSKVDVYVRERDDFGWIHQCVDNYLVPRELPEDEEEAFATAFDTNVEEEVIVVPPAAPVPQMVNLYRAGDSRLPSKYPAEQGILKDLDDNEIATGDNVVGTEDLNDPFMYRDH